ncbi:MAG: acyl carrier protein [Micropepsaceae bacterium]
MSANTNARKLLADALSMPEQDLPADIRIGSIDQWDSLAHARILLALEETIGKPLDAAEAATIESVTDIAASLSRHAKTN